jgi:hypothetical protein
MLVFKELFTIFKRAVALLTFFKSLSSEISFSVGNFLFELFKFSLCCAPATTTRSQSYITFFLRGETKLERSSIESLFRLFICRRVGKPTLCLTPKI